MIRRSRGATRGYCPAGCDRGWDHAGGRSSGRGAGRGRLLLVGLVLDGRRFYVSVPAAAAVQEVIMPRLSNAEKVGQFGRAASWLVENKVWKSGMTADQLKAAAQKKGAPA